ncbi:MAG TPA: DUF1843 domain-containing protein [Longimicrobium sp.]|nr:DUF1843 domain-containing protein [Longimicrobium sp.]
MENRESNLGSNMPYGAAIREAQASGDSARIHQATEHARRWLQDNAGHEKHGEVKAALRELEESRGS